MSDGSVLHELRLTSMCSQDLLKLDANWCHVDDQVNLGLVNSIISTCNPNVRCLTLNMARKNGRKWSNISVKKYHQSPTFGDRSVSSSLRCM
jgi:hypothetical protein